MIYTAPFDVSLYAGTITVLQTSGGASSAAVTLSSVVGSSISGASSTIYFHYDVPSYGMRIGAEDRLAQNRFTTYAYTSLAHELEAAINGTWTPDIAITWSSTTGKYTMSCATSFSITFDATAIAEGMPYLFGFTGSKTTATSHTSDFVVKHAIVPDLTASSVRGGQADALNYEPRGIGNHVIADDGTGYGLTRVVSPLYRDWVQEFETRARTERIANGLTAAYTPESYTPSIGYWTFQDMFEYCRGIWPFMVISGFGETYHEVFSFRDDGLSWNPERAAPGDATHFHIPFKTVVEGMVIAYSPA